LLKKRGVIKNFAICLIIALAMVKGKPAPGKGKAKNVKPKEVDEDGNFNRKIRKFTEKEKADLLKKVKVQLNNVMSITTTNEYVVNLGFQRLRIGLYLAFINNVLTLMATDIHYHTPTPTITVIDAMIDLENSTRSGGDTYNANIYLKDLKDLMKQLTIYIANTCGKDVVVLRGVGVRENHGKGATVQPSAPTIIDCKDTNRSGEAKAFLRAAMAGAQGYKGQYRVMTAGVWGPWISCGNSQGIRLTFRGLPLNVALELQIQAIGTVSNSNWSNSWPWSAR
jgi:hypothetical protein